jgi:hypothetical protein
MGQTAPNDHPCEDVVDLEIGHAHKDQETYPVDHRFSWNNSVARLELVLHLINNYYQLLSSGNKLSKKVWNCMIPGF